MNIKLCFLSVLLLVSLSCRSQHAEEEKVPEPSDYLTLNDIFLRNIQKQVVESQSKVVLKEKEVFNDRKINDNNYLSQLEELIEEPYASLNESFFSKKLKTIITGKFKNTKIKSIYFLSIRTNAGMIRKDDYVLIEGFDYEVDLFAFTNISSEITHLEIDDNELVDFTHEFMLNIPYSFENETFYNNSTQYFTLDKITSTGANRYIVESKVVPRMLYYQKAIIDKFFNLKSDNTD